MSQLLHLQDKLQTVGATLGRMEMELARHPESSGLAANMRSMLKLHATLQEDFAYTANQVGLDVLHYRLLENRPTAKMLSSSVGTFQDSVSVAYEALRDGPKSRRTVSSIVAVETALQVAYSYPGSFGVVFTVPNERMLLPDIPSRLDRAIAAVLELGKAHDSKTIIADTERQLGKATVAAVYSWAKANSVNRTGTAIEWRRSSEIRAEVLIQEPEFRALSEALESTAGRVEEKITLSGTLVGADINSQRFHFVTSADEDIRGRFSDAISEKQKAQLPQRYRAELIKTTETTYATDEPKITYFLEKLEPL